MKRPHLTYTFGSRPAVLEATRTFMAAKPWRSESNFHEHAQGWANAVTGAYGAPPVTIFSATYADEYTPAGEVGEVDGGEDGDSLTGDHEGDLVGARIHIFGKSMFRLFRLMGRHLYITGHLPLGVISVSEEGAEAWKWATSLFYRSNPTMFRARVRDRRINVDPYGLYTSATEQLLRDYDVDPCASNAITLLAEAQRAALVDANDESDSIDDSEPTAIETSSDDSASEIGETPVDHDELRTMNTRQLRIYATQQGLTGTWSMNKGQLLEALGVPTVAEVR